jgi:FdhD protein
MPLSSPPLAAGSGEPVGNSPCLRWSEEGGWSAAPESLAVEAPLAIEICYERAGQPVIRLLAVTMRTPGSDEELAIGFLLAEGLIEGRADVGGGGALEVNSRDERIPTWRVSLTRAPREDWQRVSRGLITSSACGLCGRTSLEGLPVRRVPEPGSGLYSEELVASLPERLRMRQTAFAKTGGSHGAALCDAEGRVHLVREDVGRHNAVDKVMGAALLEGIAHAGKILVLSGRASFELLQKAASAGIGVVVAVGAPSSLAVELAHAAGITLIGFTRGTRFNVYTHAGRLRTSR